MRNKDDEIPVKISESSFWVEKEGKTIILDVKNTKKLDFNKTFLDTITPEKKEQ